LVKQSRLVAHKLSIAMAQKQESLLHKTKICQFWQQNRCARGDNCKFAHGSMEVEFQPDLSKTSLCLSWKSGKCRLAAEKCLFAHGEHDLRRQIDKVGRSGNTENLDLGKFREHLISAPPGLSELGDVDVPLAKAMPVGLQPITAALSPGAHLIPAPPGLCEGMARASLAALQLTGPETPPRRAPPGLPAFFTPNAPGLEPMKVQSPSAPRDVLAKQRAFEPMKVVSSVFKNDPVVSKSVPSFDIWEAKTIDTMEAFTPIDETSSEDDSHASTSLQAEDVWAYRSSADHAALAMALADESAALAMAAAIQRTLQEQMLRTTYAAAVNPMLGTSADLAPTPLHMNEDPVTFHPATAFPEMWWEGRQSYSF
jgi:hypothetical protein